LKRPRSRGIMDPMEPVLLAIGGLGLLGLSGVLLLAKRLTRIDVALRRLDALEELDRRLRDLSAEFDRKELNTLLQAKMTEMTEANRRLTHAMGEMRQDLLEMKEAKERVASVGEQASSQQKLPDAGEVVRTHLRGTGYDDVQILSDLNSLQGRSGRVVFEARRTGVMHKGHVRLKDGVVVDENVRAAYSAFP
jgi:hypothetical protein